MKCKLIKEYAELINRDGDLWIYTNPCCLPYKTYLSKLIFVITEADIDGIKNLISDYKKELGIE